MTTKIMDKNLIKKIKGTEEINMGEYGSRGFSVVTILERKDVSSVQLIFGKDIEMPFGTQFQGPDAKEGTRHLD